MHSARQVLGGFELALDERLVDDHFVIESQDRKSWPQLSAIGTVLWTASAPTQFCISRVIFPSEAVAGCCDRLPRARVHQLLNRRPNHDQELRFLFLRLLH